MKIETKTLRNNVESRYPDVFDCAVNNEPKAIFAKGIKRLESKQRNVKTIKPQNHKTV